MDSVGNNPVLENLKGLHLAATRRLLPTLREWLRTLIRVDIHPHALHNSQRERILRRAISLRNMLTDCLERICTLRIPSAWLSICPRDPQGFEVVGGVSIHAVVFVLLFCFKR